MGAGRKKNQPPVKEKAEVSRRVNCSVSARNLRKSEYGAVIFGCKHMTFQECMRKQLFGLPAGHFSYVKNVTPGLTLFLFNYSDRKLHGIFEAVSPGRLNIDPYAWTTDAGETTPYPAQVRVRVQKQCRPLSEDEFRPIMNENYYEQLFFWFELDHQQAGKLTELFLSSPPPLSMLPPPLSTRGDPNTAPSAAPSFERNDIADRSKHAVCDDINVYAPQEMAEITGRRFPSIPFGNAPHPQKTWSSLFKKVEQSSRVTNCSDGVSLRSEASTKHYAKDMHHILMTCAQDSAEHEAMDQNLHAEEDWSWETESNIAGSAAEANQLYDTHTVQHVLADGACSVETEGNARILYTEELQLSDSQTLLLKLMHDVGYLKGRQLRQDLKIYCLEQELAESKLEMLQLKNKNDTPTCRPPSSDGYFEEANFEIFKSVSESDDCILVVGGYDGSSWLSDLSSFSLSHNLAKPITSMTSIRAHASAAKVNGELFLLGGKHDNIWYDTVESYNPASNKWFRQPSLNQNKERLAALSIEEKLFAVGGGNSIECFAEVEMLDLSFGRWIWLQPMQHKRFAPAVVNINKALYAVGGYDGSDYLKSVERFDLREQKWMEIGSMGTKRGCHSVVALNEKIYALGGYDGKRMLSTVEVFEPRVCSWMMGEPMHIAREYFGAVVIGEKIYVIGGLKDNDDILESIECYKEGHGWQLIDSSAIGKRCFFSAFALCDVIKLLNETLMNERGAGSSEKHFPSGISLQLTPTMQSNVISVSVSKSSDNPTRNIGVEKGIEASLEAQSVGLNLSAGETITTSLKPWKFEQSVRGDSAILNWSLHDSVDGKEVSSSKPSKISLLNPKAWFKNRYSNAYRPFTRQGGVVFAGDEYGDGVCWKVDKRALGKLMDWEIRGWFWLTYWPNKHKTFYSENRRAEFREIVQLTLC